MAKRLPAPSIYRPIHWPAPLRHMQLGKPTLSPHALDPQVICLNIPLTLASFHLELVAQEVGPYSTYNSRRYPVG